MKQLQQEISQLQIEFRTQTKRAKESQQPKVGYVYRLSLCNYRSYRTFSLIRYDSRLKKT